ncbi:MAG: hypothetical protein GXO91_06055 [FCB group bacterium]|nr:hypothetical protein [FCB group bacterium]
MSSIKYALIISVVLLFQFCSDIASDALAPEKTDLTYTDDIKPVFDRSCIRCHGEDVQNGNVALNLSSYESIQNYIGDVPSYGIIIVPGLETSTLLIRLKPQYNDMYKYLDDPEEYNLIYDWVVFNEAAE